MIHTMITTEPQFRQQLFQVFQADTSPTQTPQTHQHNHQNKQTTTNIDTKPVSNTTQINNTPENEYDDSDTSTTMTVHSSVPTSCTSSPRRYQISPNKRLTSFTKPTIQN